jgi:hypothetical protein
LTLLVVLATAHLEDVHFVVPAMGEDRDRDRCAGNQGSADLEFAAVADSQNLIKHDLLAHIRSNLFYFNFFASSNTILFATGFYDRVHMNLLKKFHEWKIGGPNSGEPMSLACARTFKLLQQRTPLPFSLSQPAVERSSASYNRWNSVTPDNPRLPAF